MGTTDASSDPGRTRGPSALNWLENASRRAIVVVCTGACAWGIGSLVRGELTALVTSWLEGGQTGLGALILYWSLSRLWLVVALAPLSWLAGRFVGIHPVAFVVPAALTGEALELTLASLREGAGFESPEDLAAWGVSLLLFGAVPLLTYWRGRKAFERARAQSLADAAQRKAEYDAFLARAAGADEEHRRSP